MGPITLFDKSFLQSLSIDESIWFDHFFLTNICPLFYVETMADLEKSPKHGRTAEDEVRIISDKFPEMSGMPCAHHTGLCTANLFGRDVPMTGQIPLTGGKSVKSDGKTGAVFEPTPEAEAFSRWRKGEFHEVERRYAKGWREALSSPDIKALTREVRSLGIDVTTCKSMEDAKQLAERVVARRSRPIIRMNIALKHLGIPAHFHREIIQRWMNLNHPPLVQYAPYAAYVLTIMLFYQIALLASLISKDRPSNLVDIAYLFYLPFCMLFVSSDRLHEKCAHLFMRSDQAFAWGPELKNGLRELNEYYLALPEVERNKGVYGLDTDPPDIGSGTVRRLWSELLPLWNKHKDGDVTSSPKNSLTIDELRRMELAPPLSPVAARLEEGNVERFLLKRQVRRRKGNWFLVPRTLTIDDEK